MSDKRRYILTRREFIIVAALGVTGLVAGNILPFSRKRYPEPHADLSLFSAKEFAVLTAIVARFIPTVDDVGITPEDIALKIDKLIAGANREIKTKFKQMLTLVEHGTFVFGFNFSRFTSLTENAQEDYLRSWAYSSITFRRSIFQAFKKITLNTFFTDERSWQLINYKGPFV